MVVNASKLGLLLVVFTLASGELLKEERPATDKAKLRDWFFRLSLRNDLVKLKEEGRDYLPVVKLDTDDGEGEHFSILLEEDHPHPKNNCSEESASQEKLMRFVMRGLDQEFMCTEIKKKTADVPEERSMSLGDDSRRGPGRSFVRGKEKGEKPGFAEQSREELAVGDLEELGTDKDIDQIITKLNNISTVLETTEASVEVKLVSNVEEPEDVKTANKNSLGSFRTLEAGIVTSEKSVKEQSTTETDCISSTNKNLVELISDFNKMVESTSREESLKDAEVFAEVIGDKNETKAANGLDPLIDHLNAVAAHQDFQEPVYAKAIQDLVRDFRAHKLSEATWNGEKLNRVLEKIEELVTGHNPEEDISAVEVVEVSTSKESVDDDVDQMKKELEILQKMSSYTDRPVEDKQDISTVNETLGLFISNLHNLVEIVNKTESPHARSGGSQNDERFSIGEEVTEVVEADERDKNLELMESLMKTNITLEDLQKFVDEVENLPGVRSGDRSEEGRNHVIAEANTTSGEEITTKESTTDVKPSSESPGTDSVTEIQEITSLSEGSLTTENTEASGNTAVDSDTSLAQENTVASGNTAVDSDTSLTQENTVASGNTAVDSDTSLTRENTGASGNTAVDSDTSLTQENTVASGNTAVDSASGGSTEESDAEALNDKILDEDYDTEGFMNLLSSWKKKFFIILGCFIVSLVLFLIIIAVLIYKLQQSKPNPDTTK